MSPLVHFPAGAPATPPYIVMPHASSRRLPTAHHVGTSLKKGLCNDSLHRNAHSSSSRARPCTLMTHLPGGAPATPPYTGTSNPPPAVSYRRTQLVFLPVGPPKTPPDIVMPTSPLAVCYRHPRFVYNPGGGPATPASVRLLPANPVGAYPRRGQCHASQHRHAPASSGRRPAVHEVCSYLRRVAATPL